MKDINKKEVIAKLHSEGKNDSEIAKILNIDSTLVIYYRKKMGLKSNFSYSSKLDKVKEVLIKLVNEGYSDYRLEQIFNINYNTIFNYRKKYGILKEDLRPNKAIELTQFQKEVLLGTLLGDGSMRFGKDQKSPLVIIEHGKKQRPYVKHKSEVFASLNANYKEYKRKTVDERTGIFYESGVCFIPSNPEFVPIYHSFYKDKIKKIPFDLLNNFTAVSLAYLFMDDGSKAKSGYNIALNAFNIEELTKFSSFLLLKFNIQSSVNTTGTLYIKAESKDLFKSLVLPYMHDTLLYKLHYSLVTS